MAASIATALASTAGKQSQLQASKIATQRKLKGGASLLSSQAAQAGNKQIAQNLANQPNQIPQFYNNLRDESPNLGSPNSQSVNQSLPTQSPYVTAQYASELQQNRYLARLQMIAEEQAKQQDQTETLKDVAISEGARYLWRGGSLATIAEWEGLGLWIPSGLGLIADGVSVVKTIIPPEKGSVLDIVTPPSLDPKNPADIGLIVKMGVLILLLSAVCGIVMLFIGIIIGAMAGLTYVTSILGESITGFLMNFF